MSIRTFWERIVPKSVDNLISIKKFLKLGHFVAPKKRILNCCVELYTKSLMEKGGEHTCKLRMSDSAESTLRGE